MEKKILAKCRFTTTHVPHLIKIFGAKANKRGYSGLVDSAFKTQSPGVRKALLYAIGDLSAKQCRAIANLLKKENQLVVNNITCSVCKGPIHGLALGTEKEPVHVFCHIPTTPETDESTPEVSQKSTKISKSKQEKKSAESMENSLFRPGSKYDFVYQLIKEGTTFEKLQKNLKAEYGSKTANPQNVKVYIHTIGKKVPLSLTEDGISIKQ